MADQFDTWRAEREHLTPEDQRENRESRPDRIGGYWRRVRGKTLHDDPVMIFTDPDKSINPTGATIIQTGPYPAMNSNDHEKRFYEFLSRDWLWCIPVTKEEYAVAMDTGFWPDDKKPARDMPREQKLGISIEGGGNNPPVEVSLELQISNLADDLDKATEPTSQDEADALTGKLDRMLALLKLAETEFEKEYRPLKSAADAISAKWKAIGTPGRTAHDKAKARRQQYLKREQQRLDAIAAAEAQKRRAEAEAAAKAERDRLAEEQRKKVEEEAAAAGFSEEEGRELAEHVAQSLPIPEVAVAPVIAERAKSSSTFGRSAGLKKVPVGIITDKVKFITAITGQPDFDQFLADKVKKMAKAGVVVEGMKIEEQLQ